MRINNNMLAINTHRQMGGVALAQGKSMEKLSSGFRINRAGDDAAGLAISEKMRAQIRGLNTAAKNAQDGISLIQTAEGALQEVHSMLNRMVELATQSANGTFDDSVDRKNLESEVTALKDEIDRVAKSSNFNGIKLLNGDLSSSAVKNKIADVVVHGVSGQHNAGGVEKVIEIIKASESKFSGTFSTQGATGVDNLKFQDTQDYNQTIKSTVKFKDENGTMHTIDVELNADPKQKMVNWSNSKVTLDGKEVKNIKNLVGELEITNEDNKYSATTALNTILNNIEEFSSAFKTYTLKDDGSISAQTSQVKKLKIESKNGGTQAEVVSILFNKNVNSTNADSNKFEDVALTDVQNALQDKITVHGNKMFALDKADANIEDAIKSAIVQVNGEDFIFVNADDKNEQAIVEALDRLGFDSKHIVYSEATSNNNTAMTAADVKNFAKAINDRFEKKVVEAVGTDLVFKGENKIGKKDEGLQLQIGDTADDFQKMSVKINDMSSRGLKITNISVADQVKASDAIKHIKEAINTVSSTRGDLGALQNRLEHTIANINTTSENITASESRIRDVDMAKEMVELTKANILQQAAQAMLAQANQAPQGVLQLLR